MSFVKLSAFSFCDKDKEDTALEDTALEDTAQCKVVEAVGTEGGSI